jgi:hypothetical protein
MKYIDIVEIQITRNFCMQQRNLLMILWIHTSLKQKKEEKERSHYNDQCLVLAAQTTAKATPEVQIHQNWRLQEVKKCTTSSPDHRSEVVTLEKVCDLKTMSSTRPLPGTTN